MNSILVPFILVIVMGIAIMAFDYLSSRKKKKRK